MQKKALSVPALFGVSVVLAVLFVYYPVVPYPKGDPVCASALVICQKQAARFLAQEQAAFSSWRLHQFALWGAVGFAAVGASVSFYLASSKHERVRYLSLVPYMAFAALYLYQITEWLAVLSGWVGWGVVNVAGPAMWGAVSAFYFVAASACLTVYFLGRGFLHAFANTLRVFAIPGIMFLEWVVFRYDRMEMSVHVISSAPAWLTNWVVLAVASVLGSYVYIFPAVRWLWRWRCVRAMSLRGASSRARTPPSVVSALDKTRPSTTVLRNSLAPGSCIPGRDHFLQHSTESLAELQ